MSDSHNSTSTHSDIASATHQPDASSSASQESVSQLANQKLANQESPPKRDLKGYALVCLKGMAMGAADVVPGVSGGTIAFITGIYDEFLNALKNCTPASLLIWKSKGFAEFWRHINGSFLLALFLGILLSLKTFAALIENAMSDYPILVWSFFFGLIVASVVLLARHMPAWRWTHLVSLALGAVVVIVISIATPAQLPGHWWIMFFGGFIAICAMILPGVSGSFLLLLVGLYPVFLSAINDLDWLLLASFGAGAICGLLTFSRFLSWLLARYHDTTVAALIGFLLGSLNVAWPWKKAELVIQDRHGEDVVLQSSNLWPFDFAAETGGDPTLALALLCGLAGVILVLGTEYIAGKLGK